jgi:hypothetical protein
MGANRTTVLAPPDKYWRLQRRLFQQCLGKNAVGVYTQVLQEEAAALIARLIGVMNAPASTLEEQSSQADAIFGEVK